MKKGSKKGSAKTSEIIIKVSERKISFIALLLGFVFAIFVGYYAADVLAGIGVIEETAMLTLWGLLVPILFIFFGIFILVFTGFCIYFGEK